MSGAERKLWSASAHERKVENLYSGGIENYADWHNGYLNFGLWEEGIADYIKAAENLVQAPECSSMPLYPDEELNVRFCFLRTLT